MTFALIIAAAFAVMAALLLFAWPLAWALPGERLRRLTSPDMQFMVGASVSLVATTALSPVIAAALISGGENVHTIAAYVFAIEFSL